MILAVIDTNVLVAALKTKHRDSATRRTIMAVVKGKVTPLIAPEIVAEYRDVLSRGYLHLEKEAVDELMALFVKMGKELPPTHTDEEMPDEDDRVFYEVALSGKADGAHVVTGNLKHYPKSPIVITPAEFCALIGV